jgi:hypothetical protein
MGTAFSPKIEILTRDVVHIDRNIWCDLLKNGLNKFKVLTKVSNYVACKMVHQ